VWSLGAAVARALQTVYYTQGGRKYHGTHNCPALESAQSLWEAVYPSGAPWYGGYAVQQRHEQDVYYRHGKRPCLVCLPGRGVPFTSAVHFGHKPAENIVRGQCLGTVCIRCRIVHHRDEWEVDGDIFRVTGFSLVKWPCTSALVLGLVDREPFIYDETLRMAA